MSVSFDAIILAGGRGSRLGGVDKATVQLGNATLLELALNAVDGAGTTVVVGHAEVPPPVRSTLEDPPDGGPVAGIVAGLHSLDSEAEWILVLAVDQPGAAQVIARILEAIPLVGPAIDVVCPIDGDGFPQWLLAAFRRTSLEDASDHFGSGHGLSMRTFTTSMVFEHIAADDGGDVDTWDDLERWESRVKDQT